MRAYNRVYSFRRGDGCDAERDAVPQPSPRNSSYWTGISRKDARIFARPNYSLPGRETSQSASASKGSSTDSSDTRVQRSSNIAVSLASVLHGQESPLPNFLRLTATQWRRKMLMHQKPSRGAPFPNPRIPDLCFYIL